jgi:hypothetical protein
MASTAGLQTDIFTPSRCPHPPWYVAPRQRPGVQPGTPVPDPQLGSTSAGNPSRSERSLSVTFLRLAT